MNLSIVGISHHAADLAVREAFSLGADIVPQLLRALREDESFSEALVLDTCNRTEVYFVPASDDASLERLLDMVSRLKGIPAVDSTSVFYRYDGPQAVEHLFHVAAALDSQIVGEHQILGQLKAAYNLACEEGTAGFLLNKLMHRAFRVGKRSQSETQLSSGSTSVAQAAVDLSQQVFSSLTGKSAMLVGAGRTGELAAKALVRGGVDSVIIANRSIDRAQKVAANILQMCQQDRVELDVVDPSAPSCSRMRKAGEAKSSVESATNPAPPTPMVSATRAIGLGEIVDHICQVDLVICATGSPDMVLTHELVGEAIKKSHRSLFIVDIAVPRDVDPQLGRLPNVFLYNMDDLDRIVAQNIEARRQEIPLVEAIIADEIELFNKWIATLEVTATIKLLQQRLTMISTAEIKRYGKMFNGTDQEQLDKFTDSLCNKILHHPIAILRDLSADGSVTDRLAMVEAIHRIFQLEDLKEENT